MPKTAGSAIKQTLKKLARTVKMDGFRPGKVPMNVVAQRYGYSVQYEIMNDKVGEAFSRHVDSAVPHVAGRSPAATGGSYTPAPTDAYGTPGTSSPEVTARAQAARLAEMRSAVAPAPPATQWRQQSPRAIAAGDRDATPHLPALSPRQPVTASPLR